MQLWIKDESRQTEKSGGGGRGGARGGFLFLQGGSLFSLPLSFASRRISRLYEALLHACVGGLFYCSVIRVWVNVHPRSWWSGSRGDWLGITLRGFNPLSPSLSLFPSALLPIINLRKFLISLLRRPALSLCSRDTGWLLSATWKGNEKKKKLPGQGGWGWILNKSF